MMKCVFHELKTSNQCTECDCQDISEPAVLVKNLLKDACTKNNGRESANNKTFSPWYQANQDYTVLMFKYSPPMTSDLLDGLVPEPNRQTNNKNSQTLQEFRPEYSSTPWSSHVNQKFKYIISPKSSGFSTSSGCSLNLNHQKREVVSSGKKEKGLWFVCSHKGTSKQKEPYSTPKNCGEVSSLELARHQERTCSFFKKTESPSAVKQINETDIESLKSKYHISSYHRGKWLICTKGSANNSLWRDICKMVSHSELPHCNAKYQRTKKEIWLYCDFIDSCNIRQILRNKLNIIQALSYCIHPYGVIMKI